MLHRYTALPYIHAMLTVVETPTFSRLAADYWSEEEGGAFTAYIANHPDAGDVIRGSGGLRKVRWSYQGKGKRGGVRVVYYNRLAMGEIWLLLLYPKNLRETIPAHVLRAIRTEIDDD